MRRRLRWLLPVVLLLGGLGVGLGRWVSREQGPRVVLIGLDGVGWEELEPLIESGRTPTLATLAFTGLRGDMITPGDGSPAKWTTMVTGVFPERHGITGFQTLERGKMVPLRSYNRRHEAIWNLCGELGRTVGVVNFLATWPPEEVAGYMVSDRREEGVWPGDLDLSCERIDLGEYGPPEGCAGPPAELARGKLGDLAETFSLAAALRRRRPTDLFIAYTHTTDTVGHRFWKYMQPERFRDPVWRLDREGIGCYREVIPRFLEAADRMVERIIADLGPETTIFVVADHGMGPNTAEARNPMFLYDRLYRRLGLQPEGGAAAADRGKSMLLSADPSKYDWREWAVLRTPTEWSAAQRKAKIEEIRALLLSLTIEPGGEPLFAAVETPWSKPGATGGPPGWALLIHEKPRLKQQAEELTLVLPEGRMPLAELIRFQDISGTHVPRGIFIASGRGIRNTLEFPHLHGADIAPTLLYLLDLPVFEEMDGRVMTEIIEPEYLREHPIRTARHPRGLLREGLGESPTPVGEHQAADEAALEELRALGYVQ
jgi:predicted AlkP superfamily phosphohydrolase/phosphomutase